MADLEKLAQTMEMAIAALEPLGNPHLMENAKKLQTSDVIAELDARIDDFESDPANLGDVIRTIIALISAETAKIKTVGDLNRRRGVIHPTTAFALQRFAFHQWNRTLYHLDQQK